MRYIEDKNFEYKDELLKQLRAYNYKCIGAKDSSNEYFYAFDGDKLVGSVCAKYSWDWIGIGSMFYEDIDVLRRLISEVSDYYRNKAVGMKLYTEVESRAEDFKDIGFEIGGITEKTPKTTSYFYLKNTDFDIKSNTKIRVMVVKEKIDKYNSILLDRIDKFNKDNNIYPMEERNIMFVALDGEKFAGGVHGSITEDSMYIGWLVVSEEYKGNGIGKSLMYKMEEKAKGLNVFSINLGTTDFQAEKFYEKLGYKVIFTKENDPKGYKSYSMVKELSLTT
ncbi:GNAT family N-acetyltransferase [Alkalicella caledoniensis]|uniref:GNAT family N-acetyltransferase n=1 Tax=Alkalicella caledoniensis TaxID=2731377 RepID=A0A7G9W6I2_ALKCA|nr:GNAT family N-acetyltransferase [Alkalicella caledoniensis]QNO14294.1 GNAT family N-acetyltransferase [Alkalicella caledoniensis]